MRKRLAHAFIPQEHGGWAMLLIPLIASALVRGVSAASVAFLVFVLLLFFARQPAALLWRQRFGYRVDAPLGLVRTVLSAEFAAAAAALAALVWLSPPAMRPWLLGGGVAAGLALVVSARLAGRLQATSAASEWLAVVGATLLSPAYGLALGQPAGVDWLLAFYAGGYFACSLARVRAQGRKRGDVRYRWLTVVYHVGLLAVAAAATVWFAGPLALPLSLALPAVWAIAFAARAVANRPLPRVGWIEVAFSVVFLCLLVIGGKQVV